ncbi:MAG: M20 family metallopeptidase [Phycisphaerae bacterium]
MKELLKNLIQADTTFGKGELHAAKVLQEYFTRNLIESEIDCWEQTRANIVAHVKGSGEKPSLLFVSHLDVVPPGESKWKYPAFSATEENGKIFGRGSADMKGSIAAAAAAIAQIVSCGEKLKGDIILAAVAGEETDSCGAKRFTEKYINKLSKTAGVIVNEPTDFGVITAHRGLLWVEVITKGKTAHGSMPHLGINAIKSMRDFLDELENYNLGNTNDEVLGKASMSINTIEGGKAINVVPDECRTKIDIRTLPGQKHEDIINDFKKMFAKLKAKKSDFNADISIVRSTEGLKAQNDSEFVRRFCAVVGCQQTKTAGFCTDGPYLSRLGLPVVIFGPGKCELCHQPDEYIEIEDLQKAVEYYKKIIRQFLL